MRVLSTFGDGAFEYLRLVFFITTASASGAPALKLPVSGCERRGATRNQALGDMKKVIYFFTTHITHRLKRFACLYFENPFFSSLSFPSSVFVPCNASALQTTQQLQRKSEWNVLNLFKYQRQLSFWRAFKNETAFREW